MSSNWRYYDGDLTRYERELNALKYEPLFIDPSDWRQQFARNASTGELIIRGGDGSLTPERINGLLSQIKPPHGYGVLAPLPLPEFPRRPTRPTPIPSPPSRGLLSMFAKQPASDRSGFSPAILEKEARLAERGQDKRLEFESARAKAASQLRKIRAKCEAHDLRAVQFMLTHAASLGRLSRMSMDDVDCVHSR
jgi:hypothetical protein